MISFGETRIVSDQRLFRRIYAEKVDVYSIVPALKTFQKGMRPNENQ
jgi:hypothetical protein